MMSRCSTLRRRQFWYLGALSIVCLLTGSQPQQPPACVFDVPGLQLEIARLFRAGDYAEAERRCRTVTELAPYDAGACYNLACVLARQDKTEEALASLQQAVALGFRDPQILTTDQDLAGLRDHPQFQKALAYATVAASRVQAFQRPDSVQPAPLEDAVATVDASNTAWDASLGIFRSYFDLDTAPPATEPVVQGFEPAGRHLLAWYAAGTAAGNRGDLYDNHDNDHSNMRYAMFPQLTRIEFAESVRQRRLHHGLQTQFLYNGVTIGNSSTAIVSGPLWRSQARLALTTPRGQAMLFVQYRSNHLYVYPEHRDHDPGHNRDNGGGYGDVFACNTPYMIISQGSSGSDRVFLQAIAATLAAFRPEVKTELARTGTLMPTVQMIFRHCNRGVAGDNNYTRGVAHPTVFDGNRLDAALMVHMAHAITRETLPPLVQLHVVEEDQAVPDRDYFAGPHTERLFDTPSAVARVVRGMSYFRRMVVSAENSRALNGQPLTYHWSVLRGDAEGIQIKPLNDAGSVVELRVPYHERRPIAPGSEMHSNRVDIGAFVHNGHYYSAPAFVTFFYLDNERREYDQQQRIRLVDYADPQVAKNYVDPAFDVPKQWRDEYHYADSGQLTGWTRFRGESSEQFTADGLLVTKVDAQGRASQARRVRYVLQPRDKQPAVLQQEPTDEVVALP
jgi:hypothetical protein